MFESVGGETPWEWARKRRRIFTSAPKDILSGIVVGAVGGYFRSRAGDANWKIAVGVAVLSVLSAALLPQLETLFWLTRRKSILLEERDEELRALRRATQRAPQVPAPVLATPERPIAAVQFACDRTGWARLRVTNNGAGAIFSATVQTYGLTAGAVEGRLVAARWEEVDTPTQRIAPGDTRVLRIASVEARHLPTIRNWVIHRTGGTDFRGTEDEEVVDVTLTAEPDLREAWRVRLILRASGVSEMIPTGAGTVAAPAAPSPRLAAMRQILRDAADYLRTMPRRDGNLDDPIRVGWVAQHVVPELLRRAFLIPPVDDYRRYVESEIAKRGRDVDIRLPPAEFLARLAGQITEGDLDQGFLLPDDWLQFRNTDPPENWPANQR